ncbi:hypothetical protein D9C73_009562 [Collichthys lucidus]|uniref:Uncharacterized protein n=1 Tax=Collichthys lucidus TaxID=240159 RepID=A0A4U5UMW1_COLLU|nr:hypothetical protein D9C73_009562 [Collichthys lucidus]
MENGGFEWRIQSPVERGGAGWRSSSRAASLFFSGANKNLDLPLRQEPAPASAACSLPHTPGRMPLLEAGVSCQDSGHTVVVVVVAAGEENSSPRYIEAVTRPLVDG